MNTLMIVGEIKIFDYFEHLKFTQLDYKDDHILLRVVLPNANERTSNHSRVWIVHSNNL